MIDWCMEEFAKRNIRKVTYEKLAAVKKQ